MQVPSVLAVASMLLIASCMTAAPTAETYRALGQEPGWSLEIGGGRIAYTGDYGDTRIALPAPVPRPTINGHRYEARGGGHSITADVTHSLCHDGMSGHAYADTVLVIADGMTVRGCGGPRLPAKDM